MSLFLLFIERFKLSSLVILSEGIDLTITSLTTWIRLKSERPFLYNLYEPRPITEISSNLSDCRYKTYLYNQKQLSYLKLIINSGATTKLIVCKCRATDADLENIYNNKHIYF